MAMPAHIRHRQATHHAGAEQHPSLRCVISAVFCAVCSGMRASQAYAHLVSSSSSDEVGSGPIVSQLTRARRPYSASIEPWVSDHSAVLNGELTCTVAPQFCDICITSGPEIGPDAEPRALGRGMVVRKPPKVPAHATCFLICPCCEHRKRLLSLLCL